MRDSCIPRQTDGYWIQEFDGELLLYYYAQTKGIYLSETAVLIWRLCDGQRRIADIEYLLRRIYPEATDRITQDLPLAFNQFVECGAIEFI